MSRINLKITYFLGFVVALVNRHMTCNFWPLWPLWLWIFVCSCARSPVAISLSDGISCLTLQAPEAGRTVEGRRHKLRVTQYWLKGRFGQSEHFFPFWGFSFSTDGDLEQNEATPDMDAVSFSTHLTDNKGSLNVSLGQASKWMFGPSKDGYEKKSSEWPYLVWGLAEGADAVGGGSIITRQPPPRSMSESALGVVGFVATAAAWSRGKGIVSEIS